MKGGPAAGLVQLADDCGRPGEIWRGVKGWMLVLGMKRNSNKIIINNCFLVLLLAHSKCSINISCYLYDDRFWWGEP